ncbi:MAG: hypothetical protein ACRCUY_05415, partial [Thermoguttaceae bacterium]
MAKKTEFSIETVKKYAIWVALPIGLLIVIATTVMAVSKIGQDFQAQKTALENDKKTVETIAKDASHPNEATIKEIQNASDELRGRVVSAWDTLGKDQRIRNVWPKALGAAFLREIAGKKFGDTLSVNARENYLNFIEGVLPLMETDDPILGVDRRRVQYRKKESDPWLEDLDFSRSNVSIQDEMMGG